MRRLSLSTIFTVGLVVVATQTVAAANFAFEPPTASFTQGCVQRLEIYADATGEVSNSADLIVNYNPAIVQIIDADAQDDGVQIGTGNAYQAYVANQVNTTTGEIRMTALSFANYLQARKLYATIEFTTIGAPSQAAFTVAFTGPGSTLDSNIADLNTSMDILTSVVNGSYSFAAGSCAGDGTSPQVQFITPRNGQLNVPANQQIQFRLTDNQSGIDLATVQILINGQIYTPETSSVGYTGNPLDYLFTISPTSPLLTNDINTIVVSGSDAAGNPFLAQITFNRSTTGGGGGDEPPVDGGQCPCDGFGPTEPGVIVIAPPRNPFENSFLDNTIVDTVTTRIVEDLGVTGAGALFSGVVLAVTGLVSYLSLLTTPSLLVNTLAFILGRRHGKPWGLIIDAATSTAVAFVTCRVYRADTNAFVTQTVSDPDGRYGFVLESGRYNLEVVHDKYQKFTQALVIEPNETTTVFDVYLQPKAVTATAVSRSRLYKLWLDIKSRSVKFWQSLRPVLFILGSILAVLSVIFVPTPGNIIIGFGYVVVAVLYLVNKLNRRPRHAMVVDSVSEARVGGAVIKIFDPRTWEIIDTQMTNQAGLFDYWGEPGDYAILVVARGYRYPSDRQRGYDPINYGKMPLLKVRLRRGRNFITLYVDPVGSNLDLNEVRKAGYNNQQSQFATPFG